MGPPRARTSICASAACVAALCVVAISPLSSTAAARPLRTGFVEDALYLSPDAAVRNVWMQRTRAAGGSLIRLPAYWKDIAPAHPGARFVAANPASRGYRWGYLDAAVRSAHANGLQVILVVLYAPAWAEGPHRPSWAPTGSWRPSPAKLADFGRALARRYRGTFPDLERPGKTLPRVRYYQAWNEVNLYYYLNPQFTKEGAVSPRIYRRMLNRFYAAIKAVEPTDRVLSAGLAPIARPRATVGPLKFMRKLTCMAGPRRPIPSCRGRARLDIWDTHPYTTGGPTHDSHWRNDVELGDLPEMTRLLRGADRFDHIQGDHRWTPFWITEFAWDTRPPDPGGVPLLLDKRWTAEALYRMWAAGVSVVTWFQLRDQPPPGDSADWGVTYQCGFYFYSDNPRAGRPKPSLSAFRFPFVAFKTPRRVFVWGRTPDSSAGAIVIEGKGRRGWHRIGRASAAGSGVFHSRLRTDYRHGRLRAVFEGRSSPGFSLRHVKDRYVRPFGG